MLFIGFYNLYEDTIKRSIATSAVNKIQYMLKALEYVYGHVDVFSCAINIEKKFKIYPSKNLNDGDTTIYFPLSWGGNKYHQYIQRKWIPFCLFFYLLFRISKNEHVYVYHSTGYRNAILWAHKLKKFKLILDVEEIYSDVQDLSKSIRNNEYQHFREADAYLFSTELLNGKLNSINKPHVVINGTYSVNEQHLVPKFNDGRIHVIYAGTFDVRKGGAAVAAAAAGYLTDKYVMHICGFGSEEDTNNIKRVIAEVSKKSKCTINYHGLLTGVDYIEFIQSCHIGLSTQDPDAAFNNTSFPSKILSYLSNGLAVVSIRIPAIEQSQVGQYLSYYEEQTPQKIADAIMQTDIRKDHRTIISSLDKQCKYNLLNLRHQLEV